MITLGVTDFDDTVTVQVVTRGVDGYDADGNGVKGSESTPFDIDADVQPATARMLNDLAEGVRDEVDLMVWTPYELKNDHTVIYGGERYRVVKTWERRADGFTKAAIGKLK